MFHHEDDMRVFKFEPVAYILAFKTLMACLGGLIIMATVIGQISAGRFPAFYDLGLSIALPLSVFVVLAAFTYLFSNIFTVKVSSTGLKGSNVYGFFSSSKWDEIKSADFYEIYGIPYILIRASNLRIPLAIPVWLKEPELFIETVLKYAGETNPLSELLNFEET